MTGFGNRLKEERIKQGYSLETVENETKIRKIYIQALEEEDFSILPPQAYAVGFTRRYSQFLGFDADEMVEIFKSLAFPEKLYNNENSVPVKNTLVIEKKRAFFRKTIIACIFLIMVIGMGQLVNKFINKKALAPPENPPTQVTVPTPVEEVPVEISNKLELLITTKPGLVCWLSVVVDGENVFTGNINENTPKKFIAQKTIKIKAGNAGAIELLLNNNSVETLGEIGEVVEKEFSI